MPKYFKEILIGVAPALLLFLAYIRVNVMPIVFFAIVATVLFFVIKTRGRVGALAEKTHRTRKPKPLSFDDIGGQERAKKELMEALDFLIHHKEIARMGIRPLKGILLSGPPGTGKTLMAKAAAHYCNSAFVSCSGSEFVEMYVGVGASRIRDLFREARQLAQKEQKESAVIFIDELDVIGGKRDGGQHREYDQTLNQLLTEMDGIHTSDSPRILLIAATNRKEMLDPALLRPGRFDRHIEVDLPDKQGRKHILELHARNKPLAKDVNLEKVAEETFGFSGAQLESVMNEAAIYALRENVKEITQKHLSQAIDKVMMGERTDRESTAEEKERVAIHELGHAIAAEALRPGSVSQVSLSPRARALGFVRQNPEKERYLYTKEDIEKQIMIALAGSVAEEMFYNGRSTGSKNDFDQVLNMVKTMMDTGLTRLGIVDLKMVAKEEIMKENRAIVDELTARTRELLEKYRPVFTRALDILLREETLNGEEFRKLMWVKSA